MIKILSFPGEAEGTLLKRVNRFVGVVKMGEDIVEAHIHDTGRLGELLFEGNRVLLKRAANEKRRTKWDIIAAFFEDEWILTNSSLHSRIFEETLKKVDRFSRHNYIIKREVKLNNSRIDFLLLENNKKIFVEVKGCTLREGNVAFFPDAPTERGRRHVEELTDFVKNGNEAWIVFLVMHSKAEYFAPNEETDSDFARALKQGLRKGLRVIPLKYRYDGVFLYYISSIPLSESLEYPPIEK